MKVPTRAIDEEVQRLCRLCPAEEPPQLPAPPEGRRRGGGGRISVLCRFRPSQGEQSEWDLTEHTVAEKVGLPGSQTFTFDKVFVPGATQADIFADVEHIVQGVVSGVNGSILCYGQTSAGKTFTMEGPPDCHGGELRGIIPRALATLFEKASESAAEDSQDIIRIELSMLELYLERLRDLLDTSMSANDLQIVTHRSGFVRVQGLSSVRVASLKDALSVFKSGQGRRMVGATNMNASSSRSHSIVMLQVVRTRGRRTTTAKLCLADLAGSENLKKSRFRGDLAANASITEEAKVINKSLSTLACVIKRLSRGGDAHVPFRDSKLTRVLQDAISGLSNSALIINCASCKRYAAETLSTLRFGACAKRIVGLPVSAQESRAHILLQTLRTAACELERLKLVENLQRLSQLEAAADRRGQRTPRCRRQSGVEELSPVQEAPSQPSTQASSSGKRWDVGRSSSPQSGISANSSGSASCSRSQSLEGARFRAALQRKAGHSPSPVQRRLPVWPLQEVLGLRLGALGAPLPSHRAGLSPLSLSPGPSTAARPTPHARCLSPATPMSPEATDFACTLVEMNPLQQCSVGGVLPHCGAGWEWPLTQRQILERELAFTRLKLGKLAQAQEADEEWLAWLREPLLGNQWREGEETAAVPMLHFEEPSDAALCVDEEGGSRTLSLHFEEPSEACFKPMPQVENGTAMGLPERVSGVRGSDKTGPESYLLYLAFVLWAKVWAKACSTSNFHAENTATTAGLSEHILEESGSRASRSQSLSLYRALVAWVQACCKPVEYVEHGTALEDWPERVSREGGSGMIEREKFLVCGAFEFWALATAPAENKAAGSSSSHFSDESGSRRARLQGLLLCHDVFALWAQAVSGSGEREAVAGVADECEDGNGRITEGAGREETAEAHEVEEARLEEVVPEPEQLVEAEDAPSQSGEEVPPEPAQFVEAEEVPTQSGEEVPPEPEQPVEAEEAPSQSGEGDDSSGTESEQQLLAYEEESAASEQSEPIPEGWELEGGIAHEHESRDLAQMASGIDVGMPELCGKVPWRKQAEPDDSKEIIARRLLTGIIMRRLLAGIGLVALTPIVLVEAAWQLGPEVEPFM